jgi:hypothetical protein
MQRLIAHTTTASLRTTGGTWGQVEIASTPEHVILDIRARNYDTTGHLHRDTALLNLPLETAVRLRALLGEAIEASLDCEPRQPGLWSNATLETIAHRRRTL